MGDPRVWQGLRLAVFLLSLDLFYQENRLMGGVEWLKFPTLYRLASKMPYGLPYGLPDRMPYGLTYRKP